MSVELVLYHLAVVMIGVILGTFSVAVFPLKSKAQAVARNIYLQGIAWLFGLLLALYYSLGYIDSTYVVLAEDPQSVGKSSFFKEIATRFSAPINELDAFVSAYRKEEMIK